MAIQGLSAERMKLFRIPQSSEGTQWQTTETGKSIFLHLFTVRVNYPFPSFTMTDRLNTNDKHKPLSFLSFWRADLHRSLLFCYTHIFVQGLAVAPGSCWHTLGAGVEGFASSADRPAWRGGHSTTAGGVLRPTWSRKTARKKEKERNFEWVKQDDSRSKLHGRVQ